MIWKVLTDVVFLHNACVTIYGRISKNYNHNHISAVQLHYVCRMTFHSILLAMYKYCRSPGTPCLTVYVENPQLISNIAIIRFNFASIHVDIFLQKLGEKRKQIMDYRNITSEQRTSVLNNLI